MKKLISLIISASIFLQIAAPGVGMVTYANVGEFTWVSDRRLDENLELKAARGESTEALVSWDVKNDVSKYSLEYFIEDQQDALKIAEKINFTFEKVEGREKEAKVTLQVLDASDNTPKNKDYLEYDFTGINPDGFTKHENKESISITITEGSMFPGGRVRVGKTEIIFRWKDGKIHFQTDNIKHGNITPFTFRYSDKTDMINILTGINKYKISPIHIELVDGKITNKELISVPRGDEDPGSRPGVKVEFERPRQWDFIENRFDELASGGAIKATLVLETLIGTGTKQLSFNLGTEPIIEGSSGKELAYDLGERMYSVYLEKIDENDPGQDAHASHKNIVEWKDLNQSMILKTTQLGLVGKVGEKNQALGNFTPDGGEGGKHTYLGYTINRSSMAEAFIRVEPYNGAKNTEYKYFIQYANNLSDSEANWTNLVEHTYVTTGESEGETPFTIPVPFSPDMDNQYYKITATYNKISMESQTLHYEPKEDLTIPPPTPVIKSIDNIYAVPPEELEDQPEAIGFDLTWSAPKNTSQNKLLDQLLAKGSIYYELFFHEDLESAKEEGKGQGILTKVFKVSLEGPEDQKVISVKPHGGSAGKEPASIRYSPSRETFTMENIVLKNPDRENWEMLEFKDPDEEAKYNKGKATQYPEVEVADNMPKQEVPGIYYVTMRALYDADETTGPAVELGISHMSNPKSITISPLDELIPVPTQIESKPSPDEEDPSIIREIFSWGNVDLDRYTKQMLDPLGITIDGTGKGVYEIYLYQNKAIKDSDFDDVTTQSAIILDKPGSYSLSNDDLTTLREGGKDHKGGVIRLDYPGENISGMDNLLLDGLDPNQVYYASIRVRLDLKNKAGEEIPKKRYSVYSKSYSFTTYTKPNEPGPGERVPPVPEELQIIDQPNNTTVQIGWKAPEYNKQEDEVLYYEMIRVDSRKLAKEEDSRLLSIKSLFGKSGKDDIHGWRTKEPEVYKYIKSLDEWSQATPKQASDKLQLKDAGLSPNQMYYYYVRSVLMIKGEEVYSSWVGVPVTTEPVQKPIGLKIENKDGYDHDPKREIVISFLAPIPRGSVIPTEYEFDIAVQGELDDTENLKFLRLVSKEKEEDIPTGYSHFVYKIQNAKPGKRYDIKVRIIDKVVDMVNGEYPKSLYSDRVTTRTQFDQEEQDRDDQFEAYLKYFEDKVEALRRKPYWTLEDGKQEFSVKYRSNYIIPEINSSKTYDLVIKEGVTDFTYYLPASVIASSNLSQTSFEIKQGNVTYAIKPSTITSELEVVKEALKDIQDRYIKDYYVAFRFRQRAPLVTSIREGFLTPEITVDVELATLKEEDLLIEDDIMLSLNNEINKEKKIYIKELEKALKRGKILDEDLDVIVDNSIGYIEKYHQKEVRAIIKSSIKKTSSIEKWKKTMLVMATLEGSAVAQGYQLGWRDTALSTFNIGLGYGIEITEPGSYVFKGQIISMPIIPGVGGANNLTAKYQLTDFFGIGGYINPDTMANKEGVLGAMARVLGAPRGADYTQYLKQSGIKGVTGIGMNLPMKKGEGLYLLMQVYEKNLQRPIRSVYVKNRSAVSNLGQFNKLHQPYILVAVDSKIIGQGNGLRPNDSMQVKDVLQILTNIMADIR